MPRIPQITGPDGVAPGDRAVAEAVVEVFGNVRGPFSILLHSPGLAAKLLPMVPFARSECIVEPGLRFAGILAFVRERESEYVWAAQVGAARAVGVREGLIDVLRARAGLEALTEEERAVAAYARELARTNRVSQPVFDALLNRHGAQWLVELTAVMNFYGALCGVANAFEVPRLPQGDPIEG